MARLPEPEPEFDPLTGRRINKQPWCVFCGSFAHWTYEHQTVPYLRGEKPKPVSRKAYNE